MEVKLNGLCVVFLILTILMSIAVVYYKLWRMRSRTGSLWKRFVRKVSREEGRGLPW